MKKFATLLFAVMLIAPGINAQPQPNNDVPFGTFNPGLSKRPELVNWYGPAQKAIDDYIKYYYKLPASLDDLRLFVKKMKKEYPDDENLFFGGSKYLLRLLSKKQTYYSFETDSCIFKGGGEYGVFYSPSYTIGHYYELIRRNHRDYAFPVALYDNSGDRIEYDPAALLLEERLREIEKQYNHVLFYRDCMERCRVLLEFRDSELVPLVPFPESSQVGGCSIDGDIQELEDDIERVCAGYLARLRCILMEYYTEYPELELGKIIFPCLLKY